MKQLDVWVFTNKDALDADKSCFVKCSLDTAPLPSSVSTDSRRGTSGPDKTTATVSEKNVQVPIDELYLFLELTSTIRLRDKGNGRSAIDSVIKKRYMKSSKTLTSELNNDGTNFGRSWFGGSEEAKQTSNSKRSSRGVARKRSRNSSKNTFAGDDSNENQAKDLSTDPNVARRGWFASASADSKERGISRSPGQKLRKSLNDNSDEEDSSVDSSRHKTNQSGLFGSNRLKSSVTKDIDKKREVGNRKSAEEEALLKAMIESSDQDDSELPTVEMCSGWVLIPLASTLKAGSTKLKLKLSGGSPFTLMDIKKTDVPNRAGMWEAMKRAMGIPINSELQLLISPFVKTRNDGPTVDKLIARLPPNIILPTNGTVAVGLCRALLIENQIDRYQGTARTILPQSGGPLLRADPVISSLPRILSDPAACRVFFLLWSIEGIKEIGTKPNEVPGCKIENISLRAIEAFKNVVLKVWRAFSSPECQPNRFVDEETVEMINIRELRIRELAGLPPPVSTTVNGAVISSANNSKDRSAKGGTLLNSALDNKNVVLSSNTKAAVPVVGATTAPKLTPEDIEISRSHTPFNTRELLIGEGAIL